MPDREREQDEIQEELELSELRQRPNRQHSPAHRRRSGRAAPAVPGTLTLDMLLAGLTALRQAPTEELDCLVTIARAFDPSATIETAPGIVRAAGPERLDRALGGLLDAGTLTLAQVWDLERFHGHRDLAEHAERSGQVKHAHEALLAAARRGESTLPYPWLHRHDVVGWAMDLEGAQQAILQFVGQAYEQRPSALARWMRRGYDPAVYHALTILHSARTPLPPLPEEDAAEYIRWVAAQRPPGRHLPRRRLMDPPNRSAWPLAVALDPGRGATFAVWYFQHEAAIIERLGWPDLQSRRDFMLYVLTCPPEWDV